MATSTGRQHNLNDMFVDRYDHELKPSSFFVVVYFVSAKRAMWRVNDDVTTGN